MLLIMSSRLICIHGKIKHKWELKWEFKNCSSLTPRLFYGCRKNITQIEYLDFSGLHISNSLYLLKSKSTYIQFTTFHTMPPPKSMFNIHYMNKILPCFQLSLGSCVKYSCFIIFFISYKVREIMHLLFNWQSRILDNTVHFN